MLRNDTTEVYDEVSERLYRHISVPVERGPTAFLHSGGRKWESGTTGPPGSVAGSSSLSPTLILCQIKIKRRRTVRLHHWLDPLLCLDNPAQISWNPFVFKRKKRFIGRIFPLCSKLLTSDLRWWPLWGLRPAARRGPSGAAAAPPRRADVWTAESSPRRPPRCSLEPEHTDNHRVSLQEAR